MDRNSFTRRQATGMSVLAVLAVLALTAAVVCGIRWNSTRLAEQSRAEVLATGRQAAVDLTTVHFSSAKADAQKVLGESSGNFAQLFTQNVDSYVGNVETAAVVSRPELVEAAVKSLDGDTAEVMAAVTITVTNKLSPNGERRDYRMLEWLERTGDRWLVSRLDFIP